MKNFIFVLLFYSMIGFAQKEYQFDYLLEYEVTLFKDSLKIKDRPFHSQNKSFKKFYLSNSKNNSYLATVTEKDSLYYNIVFKDENGIIADINFLKSSFKIAEFLKIKCENVGRYRNPYKFQTENYNFVNLKDTLYNGELHRRYMLIANRPKIVKRKKLGIQYFLIDNELTFHQPLLERSTAFEEWKSERNIPNGLFREKYFVDYYGRVDSKEVLVNFQNIDKKIIVDKDCDYTINKNPD